MEPDEDVLEMVRRQLDRDPPPSTEALYGRAARINEDIYGLSLRQFNATYVLRVKREQKRAEREGRGSGTGGGDSGPGPGGSGGTSGAAAGGGDGDDADADEVEPRPGGFLDALEDAGSGDDASGAGGDEASAGDGTSGADASGGGGTEGHQARRSRDDVDGDRPAGEAGEAEEGGADAGLRARIREVLWRYARQVAAGTGMAGAVAAVESVDDRVDEILDLATVTVGETAARETAAD